MTDAERIASLEELVLSLAGWLEDETPQFSWEMLEREHPWIAQRRRPSQARCVLCGNPSPRLDPVGVCAACRLGPVPPPEE